MSYVTTAVLMVDWAPFPDDLITEHNFDKREGAFGQFFRKIDGEHSGGSKYPGGDLYAAGFNYVVGDDIEDWLRSLPWGDAGKAFLVWSTNGEHYGSAAINWAGESWWQSFSQDASEQSS